jgi:hypothetical protein
MADNSFIEMADILKGLADIGRCFSDSTLVIYLPTAEQKKFIDQVMRRYIEAPPAERAMIHDAFRGCYGLLNMLVGYVYEAAEQVRLTGDASALRAALTAASIEDTLGKVDYRDHLLALAELFVSAEEAGLDPGPSFEEIFGLKDFSKFAVVKSRQQKK